VNPEAGDKNFSTTFNNLAVLVFYCRLQLIQNFLTNGLICPHPRTPTTLEEICYQICTEELQLANAKS
jgi:hypothetical protein